MQIIIIENHITMKLLSELTWGEIEAGIKSAHKAYYNSEELQKDYGSPESIASHSFDVEYGWTEDLGTINRKNRIIGHLSYLIRTHPDMFSQYE